MNETAKPFRSPNYRLEKMDQELLLFNPHKTTVLYLNESASVIWQLCDGSRSIAEISALLADAYPEAAGDIPAEVNDTISLFLKNEAITLI